MNREAQNIDEVRRFSRHLVRELDVVKGEYLNSGYTFTQCHVLFELSQNPRLNLLDLAKALLLDKSNTSRTVKQLVNAGLVKMEKVESDQRQRLLSLTAEGKSVLRMTVKVANRQVSSALDLLTDDEQQQIINGMRLYTSALRKSRLQQAFEIRRIRAADNQAMGELIRAVMTEYGAVGEGYSIVDPEVEKMSTAYRTARHCYYVVEKDGQVMGGGGVAPLKGGNVDTCELRKMFFAPEARGIGLGFKLLKLLMQKAKECEFKFCYLESLERMPEALRLYQRFGFQPLSSPQGCTGHSKCECYYQLDLSQVD